VIREEDRVNDVKGMEEESGGKKVDHFERLSQYSRLSYIAENKQ